MVTCQTTVAPRGRDAGRAISAVCAANEQVRVVPSVRLEPGEASGRPDRRSSWLHLGRPGKVFQYAGLPEPSSKGISEPAFVRGRWPQPRPATVAQLTTFDRDLSYRHDRNTRIPPRRPHQQQPLTLARSTPCALCSPASLGSALLHARELQIDDHQRFRAVHGMSSMLKHAPSYHRRTDRLPPDPASDPSRRSVVERHPEVLL